MSSKSTHSCVLWITRTSILIALLVVLQYITAGTAVVAGQYITGTCVNAVLAVAVLVAGFWSGAAVAVISPFCARLFGIGPQLIAIVPAIAVCNLIFVAVLHLLIGSKKQSVWMRSLFLTVSAAMKFLALNSLVVHLILPLLAEGLKPQQIKTFTAMFSYPQFVTALLGGAAALAIVPILRKAVKNN